MQCLFSSMSLCHQPSGTSVPKGIFKAKHQQRNLISKQNTISEQVASPESNILKLCPAKLICDIPGEPCSLSIGKFQIFPSFVQFIISWNAFGGGMLILFCLSSSFDYIKQVRLWLCLWKTNPYVSLNDHHTSTRRSASVGGVEWIKIYFKNDAAKF